MSKKTAKKKAKKTTKKVKKAATKKQDMSQAEADKIAGTKASQLVTTSPLGKSPVKSKGQQLIQVSDLDL